MKIIGSYTNIIAECLVALPIMATQSEQNQTKAVIPDVDFMIAASTNLLLP